MVEGRNGNTSFITNAWPHYSSVAPDVGGGGDGDVGGVVDEVDGSRRLLPASSFIICLITGRGVSGNRRQRRRQAGVPEGARAGTRTEPYSHRNPQAISVTSSPSGKTQLNFKMICKHPPHRRCHRHLHLHCRRRYTAAPYSVSRTPILTLLNPHPPDYASPCLTWSRRLT